MIGPELPRRAPQAPHVAIFFGGAIVAAIWAICLIEYATSGLIESNRAATRQWMMVGAIFVTFAGVAAFADTIVAAGTRRFSAAVRQLLTSLATFRVAGRFDGRHILGTGVASLTALLEFSLVPRDYLWLAATVTLGFGAFVIGIAALRRVFVMTTDAASLVRVVASALMGGALLATTGWLAVVGSRRIVLFIAGVQTVATIRMLLTSRSHASAGKSLSLGIAVLVGCTIGWLFFAAFTFAPIAGTLFSGTISSVGAVVVFAAAIALVLLEFYGSQERDVRIKRRARYLITAVALACFVELSLRTDRFVSDWIPYHREFWIGSADFIRAGGWLLWDVPSQYGFLSAISLAVWPASSTWQALYEETAVFLVCDALVLFALLRYRKAGTINAIFATAVTAATFFTSAGARVPFGWRLYPQAGLRFTGVVALLGIAFAIHTARDSSRRRGSLYALGFGVWALSLLWSFESGALASFVWIPFVTLAAIVDARGRGGRWSAVNTIVGRMAPFAVIPLASVMCIEAFYRTRLGHGPDWSAFVEYSLAYADAQVKTPGITPLGPGWAVVATLIAVGSVAIRACGDRRRSVPVYAACFFGCWGAARYFTSEGFDNHVNSIAPIFVVALAVLFALERAGDARSEPVEPAAIRAFVSPLFVLLIVQAFTTGEFASFRAPLVPGFTYDVVRDLPEPRDELTALAKRARIGREDRIIYPDSIDSVKLDQGLHLPFLRTEHGELVARTAWLPISPIGPFSALMTLPFQRQQIYLRRYYEQVGETGWIFAYHRHADCSRYMSFLSTTRIYRSANYELALCVDPTKRSRHSIASIDR